MGSHGEYSQGHAGPAAVAARGPAADPDAASNGRRARYGIARILDDAAADWRLPRGAVAAIAGLPLIVASAGIGAGLLGEEAYKWFTGEDRAGENLQVLAFGLAFVLAVRIAARLREAGRGRMALPYLGLAAACFFLVGEELAWGQRLLGLETPEPLEELNRQGDLTVHNIYGIEQGFRWLQILVGAAGTVLPVLVYRSARARSRLGALAELIPHHTLVPSFLFLFVWRTYRNWLPAPSGYEFATAEFSEVVELNFALVVLLFLVYRWRRTGASAPERFADPSPAGPVGSAGPASSIHEVLTDLDRNGVAYCVLRGAEDPRSARDAEVDLLIGPDGLTALGAVLRRHGYVRVPSWGHAPHRFFVAYDPRGGTWSKVDVVTDLLYGRPIRALRAGDAKTILGRRGAGNLPRPDDAFLALLLHCLLDKADFQPKHRARLSALVEELRAGPEEFRSAVDQAVRGLAPGLSWPVLVQADASEDWHALLAYRRDVRRRLLLRNPAGSVWRKLAGRGLRLGRPLLFALGCRGRVVALLGPDGAGKTTLARALVAEPPLRARSLYLGTNPSSGGFGLPTTRWIAARKAAVRAGGRMSWEAVLLKGVGFANRLVERWLRYGLAHYHRLRGRLVVLDRHPCELRAAAGERTFRERLRAALLSAGAPRPDLVLVLDAPAELLQRRTREHSVERLQRMRRAYLGLEQRLPRTRVLDTTAGAEQVKREVISLVWRSRGDEAARRPSRERHA